MLVLVLKPLSGNLKSVKSKKKKIRKFWNHQAKSKFFLLALEIMGLVMSIQYINCSTIGPESVHKYSMVHCIACGRASQYAIHKPCGILPVMWYGGYMCEEGCGSDQLAQ